jgi:hypothetical protein
VELKRSLEAALQMELPAGIVFDHPSVPLLAGFLGRQLTS